MSADATRTAHTSQRQFEDLLGELQRAADDHRKILDRQAELINLLRAELTEVSTDDNACE
jgi:hypothetical protein